MTATVNVDLVLVIDTSDSMRPCIEQLKQHLRELIKPMQGHVNNVRFGLVGVSASESADSRIYRIATLAGGSDSLDWLYARPEQYPFLSDDPDRVIERLDALQASGDEDNVLALDIALDHPFGPVSHTKRVVALFSDEPLETGVRRGQITEYLPRLIEKLHARRIKLFCAMPYSDAAQQLSEANGSEIEDVGDARGLAQVDFRTLLGQMGKSISVSSLQSSAEAPYQRALFGQDRWTDAESDWNATDQTR